MDESKVPFIVFEGEMARYERTIKRLIKLLVLVLVLLFASNMAWLYFFNSFDIVESDVISQDTDSGGNNLYGNNGAIINVTTSFPPAHSKSLTSLLMHRRMSAR